MKRIVPVLDSLPTPCPWKNPGVWCFSLTEVSANRRPFTHNAFAEIVDDHGNYRGRELGPFRSRALAESAVSHFKP